MPPRWGLLEKKEPGVPGAMPQAAAFRPVGAAKRVPELRRRAGVFDSRFVLQLVEQPFELTLGGFVTQLFADARLRLFVEGLLAGVVAVDELDDVEAVGQLDERADLAVFHLEEGGLGFRRPHFAAAVAVAFALAIAGVAVVILARKLDEIFALVPAHRQRRGELPGRLAVVELAGIDENVQ